MNVRYEEIKKFPAGKVAGIISCCYNECVAACILILNPKIRVGTYSTRFRFNHIKPVHQNHSATIQE